MFFINNKAFIAYMTFLILVMIINLIYQALIIFLPIKKIALELTKRSNITKFCHKTSEAY